MSRHSQRQPPSVYRIRVLGVLGDHWSDYLGGMHITAHPEHDPPETVLCGPVMDQAALLGALTTLYDMGFELLDVIFEEGDCLGESTFSQS